MNSLNIPTSNLSDSKKPKPAGHTPFHQELSSWDLRLQPLLVLTLLLWPLLVSFDGSFLLIVCSSNTVFTSVLSQASLSLAVSQCRPGALSSDGSASHPVLIQRPIQAPPLVPAQAQYLSWRYPTACPPSPRAHPDIPLPVRDLHEHIQIVTLLHLLPSPCRVYFLNTAPQFSTSPQSYNHHWFGLQSPLPSLL